VTVEKQINSVSITNKDAFASTLFTNQTRELVIAVDPEDNVSNLISVGALKIESSKPEIATINGLVVTGVSEGTATINVSLFGKTDSVDVTVGGKVPEPAKVNATPSQVMAADDTNGKVIYHVEGYVVSWGSKTEWTQYGEMTLGDAADSDPKDGMYVYGSYVEGVTFEWNDVDHYSFKYTTRDVLTNDLTKNLHIGDKVTMDVIRTDYGTTKEVKGQILAVEPGAFVAATGVKIQLNGADATAASLRAKENLLFKAIISPDNASESAVWSSSDETVATVKDGFVKALKAGTATITAKVNNDVKAELALTVTEALTVTHAGTQADPYTVDEAVAVVGGLNNQAYTENDIFVKGVVFSSSYNTQYANYTIWLADSTGAKAFELYAGVFAESVSLTNEQKAAFQADDGLKGYEILIGGKGQFYNNTLEVTRVKQADGSYIYPQILSYTAPAVVDPTGISLDKESLEIEVGANATLKATLAPEGATGTVNWSSSDETIATVDAQGKVTGVAVGNAVITAKISDAIKATCNVTVKAAAPAPEYVSLAKYTFESQDASNTRSISAETASLLFKKAEGQDVFKEVKTVENVYESAAGGSDPNKWSISNVLKIGKSKTAGSIKLETNVDVAKVVLKGASWTKTSSMNVNGDANAEAFKATQISKDVIVDNKLTNAEALAFTFDAAKEITISVGNSNSNANFGVVITEIEFFGIDAGTPAAAQPTGAFHGLAKTAAGTFIPVDLVLAESAISSFYINGEAVTVTSYAWDGTNSTISIVTEGAYGTISASFTDNVFQITGLTGAAVSQLDLTYAVKLSGNCQFLDCEGSTAELQAMFLRRKMGSSGWEAANADDKIFSSENGKNGKGLSVKCWADGKIALTLKNDLNIPAKNIKSVGCWIYNPSATAYSTNLYFYPSAGNKDGKMVKTFSLPAGQWTFCECGVAGGSFGDTNTFYNFQFYTENVNTTLVFDNFCLYM